MASLCHPWFTTTNLSYRFPIFETSATALCGTTGTAKLAQSLYYKACTNYFPVLLCTAKLAQSTSQYYCVLQSLHKLLPSTTVTKQPWRSHDNAICRDWAASHNRTTRNGVGNCSSKTGSRCQSRKKTILQHFLKGFFKGNFLTSAKIAKICWQITVAAWMQPLQYGSQSSAAKDNSITHAAATPSNLDAAIPMRSATTASRNA